MCCLLLTASSGFAWLICENDRATKTLNIRGLYRCCDRAAHANRGRLTRAHSTYIHHVELSELPDGANGVVCCCVGDIDLLQPLVHHAAGTHSRQVLINTPGRVMQACGNPSKLHGDLHRWDKHITCSTNHIFHRLRTEKGSHGGSGDLRTLASPGNGLCIYTDGTLDTATKIHRRDACALRHKR